MKVRQYGQGMLEFILALGVISSLIMAAVVQINQSLNNQHQHLNGMRSQLFQPLPSPQWQPVETDPFSSRVSMVTGAFSHLVDADFPVRNLVKVEHEQSPYVLARLTHAWQATSAAELHERPAKLTATYHLNKIGLSSLLDVVSYIPLAKELRSSSIQLGKVNADVVPAAATCRDEQCR
ncbi:MAG: hypothetical protein GYB30_11540 [Gammaproteobacteria bacterium]|jgi:hypothetical protein|nr:hypothetical protein [Gammaproteobacteria bacterium]